MVSEGGRTVDFLSADVDPRERAFLLGVLHGWSVSDGRNLASARRSYVLHRLRHGKDREARRHVESTQGKAVGSSTSVRWWSGFRKALQSARASIGALEEEWARDAETGPAADEAALDARYVPCDQ